MGRRTFTRTEIEEIRQHLGSLRRAERASPEDLRARLRRMGFYISDFTDDNQGFTVSDLDALLRRGTVTVCDEDDRGA